MTLCNLYRILFTFVLFGQTLFAEPSPFSVSTSDVPFETTESQEQRIQKLKTVAVKNWIRENLGESAVPGDLSSEFADRFILDYRISKSPLSNNQQILTGNIDGGALKKWFRLAVSKAKGGESLRPAFIISSDIPNLSLSVNDSATSIRESSMALLFWGPFSQSFQKLNKELKPFDGNLSLTSAPKTEAQVQTMKTEVGRGGFNALLWVDLKNCAPCGGLRLDIFLFSLENGRTLAVIGDDLTVGPRDFANSQLLSKLFQPLIQNIQQEIESAISDGKIHAQLGRLVVEGIDSYRGWKFLDSDLMRLDFISQLQLKRTGSRLAEFEFLTPLPATAIADRLQREALSGYRLKTTRVEGNTAVMRWVK